MNKVTREQLRAARVFNDHDIATIAKGLGLLGVFVGYRAQQTGRAYQSAAWRVYRVGFKTDPKAHWRDYGNKTFSVYTPVRENREPQRLAAIEWASERYRLDLADWVQSPFSRDGWFPRPVLEAALGAVRDGARLSQKDGSYVPPTRKESD
jgi:hypothetical protein